MGKTTSAAVFTFAWHGQNLEITGRSFLGIQSAVEKDTIKIATRSN
jgi:hypothetical protein